MHSERSTGAPGMSAYGAPRRRRRTVFWGQGQGLRDPERERREGGGPRGERGC